MYTLCPPCSSSVPRVTALRYYKMLVFPDSSSTATVLSFLFGGCSWSCRNGNLLLPRKAVLFSLGHVDITFCLCVLPALLVSFVGNCLIRSIFTTLFASFRWPGDSEDLMKWACWTPPPSQQRYRMQETIIVVVSWNSVGAHCSCVLQTGVVGGESARLLLSPWVYQFNKTHAQ